LFGGLSLWLLWLFEVCLFVALSLWLLCGWFVALSLWLVCEFVVVVWLFGGWSVCVARKLCHVDSFIAKIVESEIMRSKMPIRQTFNAH